MDMDLPAIQIGNKLVKFLFYRPPDMFYMASEGKEPYDIPLFLGSDVLTGSLVLPKNYARVHARYGKEGLASRLKLNGVTIEGIPNSSSLWFYSVQGLFKATFEYLGKDSQKQCLALLTDTWLSTCDMSSPDENLNLQVLTEELLVPASTTEMIEISQFSDVMVDVDAGNIGETFITCTNDVGKDSEFDVVIEESKTESHTGSEDAFLGMLNTLIESIGNHQFKLSTKGSSYKNNLLTAIRLVRTDYVDETDSGIPFLILEQYCQVLNDSTCELEQFENDFGIPVKTNLALCLLCEWIGKEFNNLTSVIAGKAEAFKLENIDRVHNLPKAESLIDILFPQSMKILLLHWMCSLNSTVSKQDHTYSPPQKKMKEENFLFKKPIFPFIQIILEFANSALVSGVAHVLHTRLLHDNS